MTILSYADIETVPDQRPGALEAFIEDAKTNFKAPSTLTKEQAAIDLGITDKDDIKFTSKDSMIARWVDRFSVEKAAEVGEANWRKTSFDGAQGQIVVISLAFNDEPPVAIYDRNWQCSEKEILTEAFRMIASVGQHKPIRFIGHNVAAFDLRFMFHRAVILGVKPPSNIPFNARPWDETIYDTMIQWAGVGNRISLDNLCKALGLPGKGEIDGSMVWDYVRDGRIEEVATYCNDDVIKARACHRRMTFA